MFQAETTATADDLFAVVSDLATFPRWIELVHQVEPITEVTSPQPLWWVTLRARIGPFARSKRLRMARTVHRPPGTVPDQPGQVRFERAEVDGRDHAPWTMEVMVVTLAGEPYRSRADCRLHYGGDMWTGPLEGQLEATAQRAGQALETITGAPSGPS